MTEPEWVYKYVKSNNDPQPLVLGTRGDWGDTKGNRRIILIAFFEVDVEALAQIHDIKNPKIRSVKYKGVQYYAIDIINQKKIKQIMNQWNTG